MSDTQLISDEGLNRYLKEMVKPEVTRAINLRTVERQLLSVKTRAVDGKYFLDKRKTGGNFRFEGRGEREKLPGFDSNSAYQDHFPKIQTAQQKFVRRFMYAATDVTGPQDQAPKTESGGHENLAAVILQDMQENIPEGYSRMLASSQCSILGQIQAISTNTVRLEVANNPGTPSVAYPWAGNRFFREGMVLDAVSGSSPFNALRTVNGDRGRKIAADGVSDDGSTNATCTITMDNIATANGGSPNAWAAADLLVPFNTRQTAAITTQAHYEDGFKNGMGIMDSIVNGSDPVFIPTYYGSLQISTAVTQQAHSINNASMAVLSLDMVNRLLEKVRLDRWGGSEEPDFLYCHPSVEREFAKEWTATAAASSRGLAQNNPIRYVNPGKGRLNVGIQGIEITTLGSTGSKILYTSPNAPLYRLYAINKSRLSLLQEKEGGFLQKSGSVFQQKEGEDTYYVGWGHYVSGLANELPRAHGYITGLKGDPHN